MFFFHSKPVQHVQYSTWCQNRGCICISSTRRTYRSNPAVSCIHSVIQTRNKILQTEFFHKNRREKISKERYKAHPMQADTRHPPATVPHASKHSTWQKPSWSPYKDSQASTNSTCRNSILSSRQHIHTPCKLPQVHLYRILQGEIGFFPKRVKYCKSMQYQGQCVPILVPVLALRIILQKILRKLILSRIPRVLCEEFSCYLSSKLS